MVKLWLPIDNALPLPPSGVVVLPAHPQLAADSADAYPGQLPILLYGSVGRFPTAFFFEPLHVLDPSPPTGQARILPLQGQVNVRIRQRLLQQPHAPF